MDHNYKIMLFVYLLGTTHSDSHLPNIVLMVADDLGMGDLGCFGNTTQSTPNIDSIASQGVKLTHHLTAASVCTPSRAAFLTGRYPIRMGMVPTNIVRVNMFISSTSGLPPEEITIAELAKKKGYTTALIGKWHLGVHYEESGGFGSHPVKQGFDTFYGIPLTNLKDFSDNGQSVVDAQIPHFSWVCLGTGLATILLFWFLCKHKYLGGLTTVLLLLAIITLLTYTWFIWSNLKLLNSVLMEDVKVIEQPLKLSGLTDRLVSKGHTFLEKQAENKEVPFLLVMSWVQVHTALHATRTVGQSQHGRYGDEVMELDWSVGQILNSLRDLDLLNNTLVYFTSDNGGHVEEKGVEGNREGGFNGIYRGGKMQGGMDGGIRVPTVAMWPGVITPGTTIDTPTSLMDVFPTLAEVLGLSLPTDRIIDGQSLMPLIRGQKVPQSRYFFHYCGNEIHAARVMPDPDGPDVWKLHFATPDWIPGTEGCRFLCRCGQVNWHDPPLFYNIGRDPSEKNLCSTDNLCPPFKSIAEQHRMVKTILDAVERHVETLNVSVTNQYAVHRLIPRPWLQPCCNFPLCSCVEDTTDFYDLR